MSKTKWTFKFSFFVISSLDTYERLLQKSMVGLLSGWFLYLLGPPSPNKSGHQLHHSTHLNSNAFLKKCRGVCMDIIDKFVIHQH